MRKYITFDWALKRLLRNKANYVVLEGFLSELLGHDVKIVQFLESEGRSTSGRLLPTGRKNKENANDKHNQVDIMCEDTEGHKIIIEVQYERQYDYFYRMLYGTSTTVTEYIDAGQGYDVVPKVYSINIVYFDLGQGTDYIYHGKQVFRGLHDDDVLKLSARQRELYGGEEPGDLMPEYYVLKVNNFNDVAKDTLDEWVSFLKTGEIPEHPKAKGLAEAKEKLRVDSLPEDERRAYYRELKQRMDLNGVMNSKFIDGKDEGIKEEKVNIARNLKERNVDMDIIVASTGLSAEEIAAL